MRTKLTALLLTLNLIVPVNLFALVNADAPSGAQKALLLLEKPITTYTQPAAKAGVKPFTLAAMSAAAIAQERAAAREVFLKTRPLDALVENVLGMMQIMQRDPLLAKYNPALTREMSTAFRELRGKYDFFYCLDPKNPIYQEVPSHIRNHFVFVLDNIKFMKGDPHAAKFQELIKETNHILGRKPLKVSRGGGVLGTIVLAAGAITAYYLISANDAQPQNIISNARAQYSAKLKQIKQNSPQAFSLAALKLAQERKNLTASIIAEEEGFLTLLEEQVNQMTSPQTQQIIAQALEQDLTAAQQTDQLKEQLAKPSTKEFKLSYKI